MSRTLPKHGVPVRELWIDPDLETRRMTPAQLEHEREVLGGSIVGRPIDAVSWGVSGGSITFRYLLGSR
jgi:hypothetical protein